MSANADSLPIEDVFPVEVPASLPVDPPVAEPVIEKAAEPVIDAPQDKAPQQIPHDTVPRWRLNEVLDQVKALKAMVPQAPQQQPQAPSNDAPKEEDFTDFNQYQRAVIAHEVQATLDQRDQQKTQQDNARQFQDRIQTADEKWNEAMYTESVKDPLFMAQIQNAPSLRADLQLLLKESDNPIGLARAFAANPALVLQINQMAPDRAIREMVKTELKLTTVTGGPSKMPSAQAPNLDPVGGGNAPAPVNPYSQGSSEEDYVKATRRLPGR